MDQEVQDARDKLAARFSNATQIGGKGKSLLHLHAHVFTMILNIGTQRRKKKHVPVAQVNEDKKLKSAIKKFGKWCLKILRRFLENPIRKRC